MPVKLDACSVIYLAKAGLLDLAVAVHGDVFITEGVYGEVVARGKERGHADALAVERQVAAGKLQVVSLSAGARARVAALGVSTRLGEGERETIAEAI